MSQWKNSSLQSITKCKTSQFSQLKVTYPTQPEKAFVVVYHLIRCVFQKTQLKIGKIISHLGMSHQLQRKINNNNWRRRQAMKIWKAGMSAWMIERIIRIHTHTSQKILCLNTSRNRHNNIGHLVKNLLWERQSYHRLSPNHPCRTQGGPWVRINSNYYKEQLLLSPRLN